MPELFRGVKDGILAIVMPLIISGWENEDGAPVTFIESYNAEEEAQSVVNEIEKLVGQEQISLKDCAVMYRVNAQSRALEETFLRYGVPYKLVGGTRFYQRQEIKDIIAYLRVIHNPQDNVSLLRIINVPGRGVGQKTVSTLESWTKTHEVSLSQALKQVSQSAGAKEANQALSPHIV